MVNKADSRLPHDEAHASDIDPVVVAKYAYDLLPWLEDVVGCQVLVGAFNSAFLSPVGFLENQLAYTFAIFVSLNLPNEGAVVDDERLQLGQIVGLGSLEHRRSLPI